MTRYLLSFDDGAMTFPEEDLPDVARAARAVVEEAEDARGFCVVGPSVTARRRSSGGEDRRRLSLPQKVREFVPDSTT